MVVFVMNVVIVSAQGHTIEHQSINQSIIYMLCGECPLASSTSTRNKITWWHGAGASPSRRCGGAQAGPRGVLRYRHRSTLGLPCHGHGAGIARWAGFHCSGTSTRRRRLLPRQMNG
jgi:hypothetical protein